MSETRAQAGSSAGSQEIERKFLIERPPDWLEQHPATELHQGYVVVTDDAEVRLRKAGGEQTLTVKRGKGEVRREEEIGLEAEQFEALWSLTESLRDERYATASLARTGLPGDE